MSRQWIAILDYGSQYTQLIARRIREQQVYSEIIRFDTTAAKLRENPPAGIILSGGPNSVFEEGAPGIDPEIFNLGIPVLGVCYGMQLMSQTLGGRVAPGESREYGKTEMTTTPDNVLFAGLPQSFVVWMSHGDRVARIPEGFQVSATSANCPYAAIRDEKRRFYAIQFHPEVVHTQYGNEIIANFLFKVCGCKADWKLSSWIDETVEKIKKQVGDEEVVLGLSGGV
ncbi:MAG TPA: GMP synthase (glutamine-hydrolyzing), partial [Verrucomicrobia bacterium]|nr:GMP synthase (glutamine-hydrolyzing) [Verrucomicrobiota bacterium]